MSTQKQLTQAKNIVKTLIEATDHLANLIKQQQIQNSFYIFSSIIEGTQAIIATFQQKDEQLNKQASKIVQYLTLISEHFEKQQYTKVLEIIQFSLRPSYVKLKEQLEKTLPKQNKKTAIGIYHRTHNPKDVITKDRLEATLIEGENQNVDLYFFTANAINFDERTIDAYTYKNEEWQEVTVPFPDVVSNLGVKRPNHIERKLQRIIPFTNVSYVGNKFALPRRILQHRKFAELLVPFTVCLSREKIKAFMKNNDKVVFKALGSNRGENIYFVTQKGSRYILLDQLKERILTIDEFNSFIDNIILAEKGSYIIQRYIHTRTKDDEPYHFRSHVHKNHKGEWEIVHIYPRIGNKRSNLSNIATEGRVEDFPIFLRDQFGEKRGKEYEKKILQLSLDVVHHLDKLYSFSLNELGLDFAIDDQGKIWMHEANNGPQTAYHEEKRAIYYIAYAKYIAENGIMYMSQVDRSRTLKGAFQARLSELPIVEESQSRIGILIGKNTNQKILQSITELTEKLNLPVYTFTPMDIDLDYELIRGSFFENGQWIQKIVEYPSVIIDLWKQRNYKNQPIVYEELSIVPFTHEWDHHLTSRYDFLEKLNDGLQEKMTHFEIVKRPLHVFNNLEKAKEVYLKPNSLTSGLNKLHIKQLENNLFIVIDPRGKEKSYNENALRNYIQYLIDEKLYIVQQIGRSEAIQAHERALAVKNQGNKWTITSRGIEDQLADHITSTLSQIESIIQETFNTAICEIEVDYVLYQDGQITITDVNPNGSNKIEDKDIYIKYLLQYANSFI